MKNINFLVLFPLLLVTPATGYSATQVAYDCAAVAEYTSKQTPFTVASELDWLLHAAPQYKSKILDNSPDLLHDRRFQKIKKIALESRKSCKETSENIIAGKARIDQARFKLAAKVGKMRQRTKKSIDFAFAAMAKYRKSFENRFKHSEVVDEFSGNTDFIRGPDPDDLPRIDECRDLALSYMDMEKLLYGLYEHQLKLYKQGKFKPVANGLKQAYLESDIASIDYSIYNLKDSVKPSHTPLGKRYTEKHWRYCTRILFKVDHRVKKLYKFLKYVRKTLYGEPIEDRQVAAFLEK